MKVYTDCDADVLTSQWLDSWEVMAEAYTSQSLSLLVKCVQMTSCSRVLKKSKRPLNIKRPPCQHPSPPPGDKYRYDQRKIFPTIFLSTRSPSAELCLVTSDEIYSLERNMIKHDSSNFGGFVCIKSQQFVIEKSRWSSVLTLDI